MRRPPDDAAAMLHEAVRTSLDAHVAQGAAAGAVRAAAIPSCCSTRSRRSRATRGHALTAVHVHHGLSPNADAWATFCGKRCAELGVACVVRRVAVAAQPRTSLEAEARRARYAALAESARASGAAVVALAHHQRRPGGDAAPAVAARRGAARPGRDARCSTGLRSGLAGVRCSPSRARTSTRTRVPGTWPGSTTRAMPTPATRAMRSGIR